VHPDLEEILRRESETLEISTEGADGEPVDEGEAAVLEVLPQSCDACGAALFSLVRVDGQLVCRCRCGATVAPGTPGVSGGSEHD